MNNLITIPRDRLISLESAARALAEEVARLTEGYGEPLVLASDEEVEHLVTAITNYHMRGDVRPSEAAKALARAHSVHDLHDLPAALVRDFAECYRCAANVHDLCEDTKVGTADRYIAALLWRHEAQRVWELPLSIWRSCADTLTKWPPDKRACHITDRIVKVVPPVGVQP